jgi:glycosyltransferase involved in cell wall biosynthesis
MLRAYDRPGGIGIYSRNIVKHLLDIGNENQYILFYNNKNHIGNFNNLKNVNEVYVPEANPIVWDQIKIPYLIKKYNVDLIFNTKFTVPIFTKAKKIMALHGASWFVHPEIYKKFDVFYVKRTMKIYCKKANFLISNSNLTTNDHCNILKVPREKIKTVYFAAGEEFHLIGDKKILNSIKEKYNLPEKFILTVISYDPVKNFGTLLDSFIETRKHEDIHLVVAGKNCYKYGEDYDLRSKKLDQFVHFTGWIDHSELPVFYNLATVYLFPSIYETFGIPVLESMACGCPVVASNTGASKELFSDAAILITPQNTNEITESLLKLLQNPSIYESYKKKGLERAKNFTWEKTAAQTLEIFKNISN